MAKKRSVQRLTPEERKARKKCSVCGMKPLTEFTPKPDGRLPCRCNDCAGKPLPKKNREKEQARKRREIPAGIRAVTALNSLNRLEQEYQRMSELTKGKCGSPCGRPGYCCKPEFCEMTMKYARETFGIQLSRTKHHHLPLMGEFGCTVAPYLRPICTIYVCETHLEDPTFAADYRWLRDRIDKLELEVTPEQRYDQRADPNSRHTDELDLDMV